MSWATIYREDCLTTEEDSAKVSEDVESGFSYQKLLFDVSSAYANAVEFCSYNEGDPAACIERMESVLELQNSSSQSKTILALSADEKALRRGKVDSNQSSQELAPLSLNILKYISRLYSLETRRQERQPSRNTLDDTTRMAELKTKAYQATVEAVKAMLDTNSHDFPLMLRLAEQALDVQDFQLCRTVLHMKGLKETTLGTSWNRVYGKLNRALLSEVYTATCDETIVPRLQFFDPLLSETHRKVEVLAQSSGNLEHQGNMETVLVNLQNVLHVLLRELSFSVVKIEIFLSNDHAAPTMQTPVDLTLIEMVDSSRENLLVEKSLNDNSPAQGGLPSEFRRATRNRSGELPLTACPAVSSWNNKDIDSTTPLFTGAETSSQGEVTVEDILITLVQSACPELNIDESIVIGEGFAAAFISFLKPQAEEIVDGLLNSFLGSEARANPGIGITDSEIRKNHLSPRNQGDALDAGVCEKFLELFQSFLQKFFPPKERSEPFVVIPAELFLVNCLSFLSKAVQLIGVGYSTWQNSIQTKSSVDSALSTLPAAVLRAVLILISRRFTNLEDLAGPESAIEMRLFLFECAAAMCVSERTYGEDSNNESENQLRSLSAEIIFHFLSSTIVNELLQLQNGDDNDRVLLRFSLTVVSLLYHLQKHPLHAPNSESYKLLVLLRTTVSNWMKSSCSFDNLHSMTLLEFKRLFHSEQEDCRWAPIFLFTSASRSILISDIAQRFVEIKEARRMDRLLEFAENAADSSVNEVVSLLNWQLRDDLLLAELRKLAFLLQESELSTDKESRSVWQTSSLLRTISTLKGLNMEEIVLQDLLRRVITACVALLSLYRSRTGEKCEDYRQIAIAVAFIVKEIVAPDLLITEDDVKLIAALCLLSVQYRWKELFVVCSRVLQQSEHILLDVFTATFTVCSAYCLEDQTSSEARSFLACVLDFGMSYIKRASECEQVLWCQRNGWSSLFALYCIAVCTLLNPHLDSCTDGFTQEIKMTAMKLILEQITDQSQSTNFEGNISSFIGSLGALHDLTVVWSKRQENDQSKIDLRDANLMLSHTAVSFLRSREASTKRNGREEKELVALLVDIFQFLFGWFPSSAHAKKFSKCCLDAAVTTYTVLLVTEAQEINAAEMLFYFITYCDEVTATGVTRQDIRSSLLRLCALKTVDLKANFPNHQAIFDEVIFQLSEGSDWFDGIETKVVTISCCEFNSLATHIIKFPGLTFDDDISYSMTTSIAESSEESSLQNFELSEADTTNHSRLAKVLELSTMSLSVNLSNPAAWECFHAACIERMLLLSDNMAAWCITSLLYDCQWLSFRYRLGRKEDTTTKLAALTLSLQEAFDILFHGAVGSKNSVRRGEKVIASSNQSGAQESSLSCVLADTICTQALLSQLACASFSILQRFWSNGSSTSNASSAEICESYAKCLYALSVQFPPNSPAKKRYSHESLLRFTEARNHHLQKSGREDLFVLLMIGKLSWQLHRKISAAIETYQAGLVLAMDDSCRSNTSLKTVRVAFFYQMHSFRAKYALQCLEYVLYFSRKQGMHTIAASEEVTTESMTAILGDLLKMGSRQFVHPECDLEEIEKSSVSLIQARNLAWKLLLDSLAGLQECRELDPYEPFSVIRVSRVLERLVELRQDSSGIKEFCWQPHWVEASLAALKIPSISFESSLAEIKKLFDKKRPQVVAIWCVETSCNSFDEVLQRTCKFDHIRRKAVSALCRLLCHCSDLPTAKQLLLWIRPSRDAKSTTFWIVSSILNCFLAIARVKLDEILSWQEITNDRKETLLGLCKDVYEVYVHTKQRLPPSNMSDLESCLLKLEELFQFGSIEFQAPQSATVVAAQSGWVSLRGVEDADLSSVEEEARKARLANALKFYATQFGVSNITGKLKMQSGTETPHARKKRKKVEFDGAAMGENSNHHGAPCLPTAAANLEVTSSDEFFV